MNEGGRTSLVNIPGYETATVLGEGGAGRVYKARQTSTGQWVAIKVLRAEGMDDGAFAAPSRLSERFERETQLCAQLHHPNIVGLLDKGVLEDGHLYAVFEFVPGETLRDYLARKGALSAAEAGTLMEQVLDALACAHEHGIAHRDLKPQNIMIMQTGTRLHVKVLDFGIAATVLESRIDGYRQLTMTREAIGTPSYSAPEQLRGEPPTTRTDLYAWGLLFIECMTGRPAIEGSTLAEIYHKQLSQAEVPIPSVLLDHPLGELLRRVTNKNPQMRAADARVVFKDFRDINLGNIVGVLENVGERVSAPASEHLLPQRQLAREHTIQLEPGWMAVGFERRQVTVLCFILGVVDRRSGQSDIDTLDALLRDQLSLCMDTARRFGGYLAGALGDTVLFYYGYPNVSDSDARRAARTALELMSQVTRRSRLLNVSQGVGLELRIGLHTGLVMSRSGHIPDGVTPSRAMLLARLATRGKILASQASRRRLEPYVEFRATDLVLSDDEQDTDVVAEIRGELEQEAAHFLRTTGTARAIVGRDTELCTMRAFCANVCLQKRVGAIVLKGEPGIGKSRLIHEYTHELREQGAPVVECVCLPEQQNSALYPFLQLVRSRLRLHETQEMPVLVNRLQEGLREAGLRDQAVLTILCSWLMIELPRDITTVQYSPDRQKRMLLEALATLIQHFVGYGECGVVVVEDLHWADATSLELLDLMLAASVTHPCLMLLSARADFSAIPASESVAMIDVRRLPDDQCAEVIRRLLGGKMIEARSMAQLIDRVDGVPLFAEELVRSLLEERKLIERDHIYLLDQSQGQVSIPITLRDSLAERLSRLSQARETIWMAAAIGREFSYQLLVHIAAADESMVQLHLDMLIRAELIYRQRHVEGDTYVFRHALIRDAAYDAMPLALRSTTHLKIAQAMRDTGRELGQAQYAQLAHHFHLGGDLPNAIRYGTEAANWAMNKSLHDEAIHQCEVLDVWIDALPQTGQLGMRLAVHQILIHELMQRYGWANERVRSVCEQTLEWMDQTESDSASIPILWSLTMYHNVASHRDVVRDLAERICRIANHAGDVQLNIAAQTINGVRHWIDGQFNDASIAFYQVLRDRVAIPEGQRHSYVFGVDPSVWAESALAQVIWFAGSSDDEALACAESALARARQLGHVPTLGIALMYLALVHQYAGRHGHVRHITEELLALAQRYGLPAVEGYGAILNAWAIGEVQVAETMLGVLRQLGCMLGLSYYASLPADSDADAGRLTEAIDRMTQVIELSEQLDEKYYRAELYRRRAIYRARIGDAQQRQLAHVDLETGLQLAQVLGMKRTESMIRRDMSMVLRVEV